MFLTLSCVFPFYSYSLSTISQIIRYQHGGEHTRTSEGEAGQLGEQQQQHVCLFFTITHAREGPCRSLWFTSLMDSLTHCLHCEPSIQSRVGGHKMSWKRPVNRTGETKYRKAQSLKITSKEQYADTHREGQKQGSAHTQRIPSLPIEESRPHPPPPAPIAGLDQLYAALATARVVYRMQGTAEAVWELRHVSGADGWEHSMIRPLAR